MFGLFKKKPKFESEAQHVFERLQSHSRAPVFYEDFKIPDTLEGRFDSLTLHLFLIIHRMKATEAGREFSQTLFDCAFSVIDQGYRQVGISDMGVPKRMKKLMLAFNGRLHAYDEAFEQADKQAFAAALDKNIYNIVALEHDSRELQGLCDYAFAVMAYLGGVSDQDIINGVFELPLPKLA
ncbi:MAG: ubiquinol-cytochrome C chaperone family protein [Alphaproteobacteria bacterium]